MRHGNASLPLPLSLAVGLILLALAATSCGPPPTRTPRASAQWSNGKLLGTTGLNNQVALQVDEWGHSFMAWVGAEHELNFARLNERAEVVVQRTLDLRCKSPLKPQFLLDPTGQLHLTWLDRWNRNQQLFYARLSTDGIVIQEATTLTPPEQRVACRSMVLDGVGRTVELFWSDSLSSHAGCYHAALDWSGTVVAPVELLISDGVLPAAQMDRQGFVHLAWRVDAEGEKPQFHYAIYDPQRRVLGLDITAGNPFVLASLSGGPVASAKFDGPWLGLDESSVYVAWTVEARQGGGQATSTFYQAFPQPALRRQAGVEGLDFPPTEVTGEAVLVQGADPALTGDPQFLDGQPEHQVLACYTQVDGSVGNRDAQQIAAIDLKAGGIEEQEIVSASRGASLRPNVAADPSGHLHLTWIDTAGFGRYQVVYASTSPQAKETLNRITTYDVVDKVLSTAMYILSAVFFTPVILGWLIIPLSWLFIFTLTTRESLISDPHGYRALGLAMLLQLGSKLLFFPSLLAQFPLKSMLSPSLGLVVGRWIFPLVLAALSAGVVGVYLRRERNRSIFAAYFIYAAIDSFLTLVVYVALPMV